MKEVNIRLARLSGPSLTDYVQLDDSLTAVPYGDGSAAFEAMIMKHLYLDLELLANTNEGVGILRK